MTFPDDIFELNEALPVPRKAKLSEMGYSQLESTLLMSRNQSESRLEAFVVDKMASKVDVDVST